MSEPRKRVKKRTRKPRPPEAPPEPPSTAPPARPEGSLPVESASAPPAPPEHQAPGAGVLPDTEDPGPLLPEPRIEDIHALLSHHTVAGWGSALRRSGYDAEESAAILLDMLRDEEVPPTTRIMVWKILDEKSQRALELAQILGVSEEIRRLEHSGAGIQSILEARTKRRTIHETEQERATRMLQAIHEGRGQENHRLLEVTEVSNDDD